MINKQTSNKKNVKIIRYLNFENVVDVLRGKSSKYILDNPKNLEKEINKRIKSFDPINAIGYSSFLNMFCQTTDSGKLINQNMIEVRESNLVPENKIIEKIDGIIFHRLNLLYFISQIISKNINGNKIITDTNINPNNKCNAKKYYETLLLMNNKLGKVEKNLVKMIIREYPPYYCIESTYQIYEQRLLRYNFIFSTLLNNLLNKDKRYEILKNITKYIQDYFDLSIEEYSKSLKNIFTWFLEISAKREKNKKLDNIGFIVKDPETFYIRKDRFKESGYIKIFKKLSQNIKGFRKCFNQNKNQKIDNSYFQHIQHFFNYPIFEIDKDNFCIIDLQFFIEGVCNGFIWQLNKYHKKNEIEKIRTSYGLLIEEYFKFLIKETFDKRYVEIPDENKNNYKYTPDAILNYKDYILIFEFTVRSYNIAHLYSKQTKFFESRLDEILFSKKKGGEGKFIKLNVYCKEWEEKNNKTIIPILITENLLGDYNLLNKIYDANGNYIYNKIKKNKLDFLIKNKPLIINLDDFEFFWQRSTTNDAQEKFIKYIEKWEKFEKQTLLFSFGSFISNQADALYQKKDYTI